jgi:Na+-driven multidrug efflux pump
VFDLKIYGISIAIVAAETALTFSAWYFFRKGKWKMMKV